MNATAGVRTCNCNPRCLQCSKQTNGLIFLTSLKNSSCVSITGGTSKVCTYALQDSARPVQTSALYNKSFGTLMIEYKRKSNYVNTLMRKIYIQEFFFYCIGQ